MKRPCEDSSSGDSDLDETIDVGCESIYPGHLKASFIRCGSPTTPTQVMARKKRRGIIEKRRRDRINNSLTELRRLVPTAFEKQGSAKLEKAEILQMTVDHLKVLQNTSGKGYLDAHSLALDFLSLGFRECVSEVCRYLGTMDTLDPADPSLPSRLLSHLTTCATNRDNTATLTSPHSHGHQYSHNINHHFYQFAPPFLPQNWASISGHAFRPSASGYGLAVSTEVPQQRMLELSQRSVRSPTVAAFPVNFHGGLPVFSQPLLNVNASNTSPTISTSSSSSQTNKPYRPWGTEVGAF